MENLRATELRIGNLVESKIMGVVKVFRIYPGSFDVTTDDKLKSWFTASECKPIQLTEEWLLKFGFEKCESNWLILSICDGWSFLNWEKFCGLELSISKSAINLKNIKYVHQLQNLYFALTGEELTLFDFELGRNDNIEKN